MAVSTNPIANGDIPAFPVLAPNGTFALPSYSFAASPNSGIWCSSNGALNLATQIGFMDFYTLGNARVELGSSYFAPLTDLNFDLGLTGTNRFGNVFAGSFRAAEVLNGKQGVAVLVAGTKVVGNTSITANSRILLTSNVDGGTPGFLRVSARVVGTSFTITSSSGTDTSTVAYEIFEPA